MMIDERVGFVSVSNFRELVSCFRKSVFPEIPDPQGRQFIDSFRAVGFGNSHYSNILPAHFFQGPADLIYGRPGAMLHLLTVAGKTSHSTWIDISQCLAV